MPTESTVTTQDHQRFQQLPEPLQCWVSVFPQDCVEPFLDRLKIAHDGWFLSNNWGKDGNTRLKTAVSRSCDGESFYDLYPERRAQLLAMALLARTCRCLQSTGQPA